MYLDCKNFYLQTTPEGMMWADFLAISHHAPYKDIVKFTYNSRDSGDIGIDLTWLVVKTARGGTLRFDPVLTGCWFADGAAGVPPPKRILGTER